MELTDFPEVIDDRKWYPAVRVTALLQVVIVVVCCLPKVEFDLELGRLCDYLVRKGLDKAWNELCIVPSILVKLFSVIEHLMNDTPLR